MKVRFLVLLLTCSMLSCLNGCGQSGHLYLPESEPDITTPGQ